MLTPLHLALEVTDAEGVVDWSQEGLVSMRFPHCLHPVAYTISYRLNSHLADLMLHIPSSPEPVLSQHHAPVASSPGNYQYSFAS